MDLLEDVRHREWDPPDEPWVLRQAWNHLLFAHWPVARDRLRERVPAFLELDTFGDEAWLSVTPFSLSDLTARGIPAVPWISSFDEINVRTYVVYDGIPGIYFFSLDANSTLAVAGASTLFHLPYFLADMRFQQMRGGTFDFRSRRRRGHSAQCEVRYAPSGAVFTPKPGSLPHFLTERYCLYTQDASGRAYRVDVHHAAWQLQPAEAEFSINTMVDSAGLTLPSLAPVLHYARRQDVVTWAPRALP